MKKLLPILLVLLGTGGGVGAGLALRPDPADKVAMDGCAPGEDMAHATAPDGDGKDAKAKGAHTGDGHGKDDHGSGGLEYVKLDNQFVIPVVSGSNVESLVVMSLSVEIAPGYSDQVHQHEPKLRDHFLEVLFAHANTGGFRGAFTDTNNLDVLKRALLESGQAVLGDVITGILITDLGRRDS